MDYNWKPFNDAYKKSPDKIKFYQTELKALAKKEAGNERLELKHKGAPIISGVPIFEEIATRQEVKTSTTEVRNDLRKEVDVENLSGSLYDIFENSQSSEFPDTMVPQLYALRYHMSNHTINLDQIYLGLVRTHEGRTENLRDYISLYIAGLDDLLNSQEFFPDRKPDDFKGLKVLKALLYEIQVRFIRASLTEGGEQKRLFSPQTDSFIQSIQPELNDTAGQLYDQLGLDPSKVHREPALFLEMAMRRERSILDWDDELQEKAAEWGHMDPAGSIGALGIQPRTFVAALLLKNGIGPLPKERYEENLAKAQTVGLIGEEKEILTSLRDPVQAMEMFTWILKMEMPKPGEPIEIRLNRPGLERKPYKLPVRETYTFAAEVMQKEDKQNNKEEIVAGTLRFTHEEMRLLFALAKYQGKGLDLMSKDSNVLLNEKEEIKETVNLVLNNRSTSCLAIPPLEDLAA